MQKITASLGILLYSLLATIVLYLSENLFHPTYVMLLIQKVSLFLLVPVLIGYIFHIEVARAGRWSRQGIWYGIGFGLFSMILIALTAWILRGSIDWDAIRASMEARHITKSTFLLVFLYIMFGNSLIEEYFFR